MAGLATEPQRLRAQALKALVLVNLGSDAALGLRWRPRTIFPTVETLEALRPLFIRAQADPEYVSKVFFSDAGLLALEECQGAWRPVVDDLSEPTEEPETIETLSARFRKHVQPLERKRSTRQKLETSWNTVVTWAAARDGITSLLPMQHSTLQAMLWDAISVGCSLPVLKGLINAVQARHGHFRLPKPIAEEGEYKRLTKALARFQGTQHRHVFPIHRDLVVRMLLYNPQEHNGGECEGPGGGCKLCWVSLYEWCNALCSVGHTIGCMRPDEGHNSQLCDWWPEYDTQAGYYEFAGGAALNISGQKNDAGRKGAHKRFGKSTDPNLDFVAQMAQFHEAAGMRVSDGCQKRLHPEQRCPLCPPLWPRSRRDKRGFDFSKAPSADMVSDWIVAGLRQAGLDTSLFSGVCARRGGLSTAIEAHVPEVILWMQSGHAQEVAARRYVELRSPKLLYATWEAFKL